MLWGKHKQRGEGLGRTEDEGSYSCQELSGEVAWKRWHLRKGGKKEVSHLGIWTRVFQTEAKDGAKTRGGRMLGLQGGLCDQRDIKKKGHKARKLTGNRARNTWGHWRNLSSYTEGARSQRRFWAENQSGPAGNRLRGSTGQSRKAVRRRSWQQASGYVAWTMAMRRGGRGEKRTEIWIYFEVRHDSICWLNCVLDGEGKEKAS